MQCLESKLDGSNYIHNCFLKTRKYFCGFVQKTTIKNHRKDGGVKYVSISSTPIYREFKSGWVRTYVCQKLLIWFRGYIQTFSQRQTILLPVTVEAIELIKSSFKNA